MKRLVVVRGTMGAGKTAVCRELMKLLAPCAWLDGDWCWMMEPFTVNGENRAMVLDNIAHLLRAYLQNSGYETVLFCWVLHEPGILDGLLSRLEGCEYALFQVALTCSEGTLRRRLEADAARGTRAPDVVGRSVRRLPLYAAMGLPTLATDGLTPPEAAREIKRMLEAGEC